MARKEKKYHFIYKTTNMLSGKYYIGMHSTDDLDDDYLGSGNRLRLAIRKHGKQNFIREIIEFCKSREELKSREAEIVSLDEITKIDCMNMCVGGEGGWNEKHNEAFKNKLNNDEKFKSFFSNLKREHGIKRFNDGNLQLIDKRCDWNGRNHSDESKQKTSETMKGKGVSENNSQYGTCWITKDGLNKKIKKEDLDTYLVEGWVKGRK